MDSHGISFIRLLDEMPKLTDLSPEWQKDLKQHYIYTIGLYVGGNKNQPTYINLYVQNIYRGIPSCLALTPVSTLVIAEILAHEVGHHLINTRGYVFEPTEIFKHKEVVEEFCDRYAVSIVTKMMAQWRYKVARWILNRLADWHFVCGAFAEGRKKPAQAAEHFLTEFHLDTNREDALHRYWSITSVAKAEQVGPEPESRVL